MHIVSLIDAHNIEADRSSTLTVGADDITSSLGNIMNYTLCTLFLSYRLPYNVAVIDSETDYPLTLVGTDGVISSIIVNCICTYTSFLAHRTLS